MYLQAFGIAFSAMMGIEVALGICLAIGAICKGASENGKH